MDSPELYHQTAMSGRMLELAFGHLPGLNPDGDTEDAVNDVSGYLPVAVLAYIGYLQGFETTLSILIHPAEDMLITVSYLNLTVVTTVAILMVGHLVEQANAGYLDRASDDLLVWSAVLLYVGLVYVSVWGIYQTAVYAESIIGLVLSMAQFLVVADIVAQLLAGIVCDVVRFPSKLKRWW